MVSQDEGALKKYCPDDRSGQLERDRNFHSRYSRPRANPNGLFPTRNRVLKAGGVNFTWRFWGCFRKGLQGSQLRCHVFLAMPNESATLGARPSVNTECHATRSQLNEGRRIASPGLRTKNQPSAASFRVKAGE